MERKTKQKKKNMKKLQVYCARHLNFLWLSTVVTPEKLFWNVHPELLRYHYEEKRNLSIRLVVEHARNPPFSKALDSNPPGFGQQVSWPQPALPGFRPTGPSRIWGSRRTPDLGPWQREAGLQDFVLQATGVSPIARWRQSQEINLTYKRDTIRPGHNDDDLFEG
jgi:hypothetical protein